MSVQFVPNDRTGPEEILCNNCAIQDTCDGRCRLFYEISCVCEEHGIIFGASG